MPDPDLQKYIFDVLEAINNLESFTAEITLDKLEKIEFKWAVERGISIIGEALYKANKVEKNLAITNLKNIISMRHIVIHDYDMIESERLYITIKKHIPILKEEIAKILKK
ncbi:MAG TPA: HepT-like ribonuclease domain-containing protein [Hanamia sp.]|nr:HepT-like ribonuclease domain-containing protein [Hanamia sp.]